MTSVTVTCTITRHATSFEDAANCSARVSYNIRFLYKICHTEIIRNINNEDFDHIVLVGVCERRCQPIERFFTMGTSWLLRLISLASFVRLDSTSRECRFVVLRSFFLRTTSGLQGSESRRCRPAWLCAWLPENDPCLWRGVAGWSGFMFGRYVWNDGRFCAASMMEPFWNNVTGQYLIIFFNWLRRLW